MKAFFPENVVFPSFYGFEQALDEFFFMNNTKTMIDR